MTGERANGRCKASSAIVLTIVAICAACNGDHPRAPAEVSSTATVWLTTADQSRLLTLQAPIAFVPQATANAVSLTIDVDERMRHQTIGGFGATLTHSSAWLIQHRMTAEQRSILMRNLFDAEQGLGLSALRHPIGASDFALSSFTFNDLPSDATDPALEHFSIDVDREYMIPVLLEARAINPELRIIGTPWSAPAWMKTSGSLIGGSLLPEHHAVFASYLVRYVQDFAASGVPIAAITPQNEPLFEPPSYPGMFMDAAQQADLIKQHLGPALMRAGLTTQIFIYDHNWDRPDYPIQVLDDPQARGYVAGSAFHCYAGNVSAQSTVHTAYPDKQIMLSECSGTVGSSFAGDLRWGMQNLFIGGMRHWASDVLLWNLALDLDSGPRNGGCERCRGVVTIDQQTGAVTYNVEYYALGHASLAARPGAVRIESTTHQNRIETVAFANPDGSIAMIAFNAASNDETFTIRWSGQALTYTLLAGAVTTFKWR